jgi:glyoxylate/hydroxypyruvate reductase
MSHPLPFVCDPDAPFAQEWVDALQAAMPDERIVLPEQLDASARETCEVAVVANPRPIDLHSLPRLRWVHSVWAGVDRLMADLKANPVKVVRLVDPQLTATMREAVLAWTLYLHRDMPRYARQQAQHAWVPLQYVRPQHKTVSILGLGALGSACAQGLVTAGFNVCGWSRTRKSIPHVTCFAGGDELPQMLARTDILVCLLPLTPRTRGLLDTQALAQLRENASLINFARGAVVDDAALRAALGSGRLSHAVLDVFEHEPLPADAWQWAHERVTVLPHVSAPTDRLTASAIVARNIRRYRADGTIPAIVDSEMGY